MVFQQSQLFPESEKQVEPPVDLDVTAAHIAAPADERPAFSAAGERKDKTAERKARFYDEDNLPADRRGLWELQAAKSKAELPGATEEDKARFRELLYGSEVTPELGATTLAAAHPELPAEIRQRIDSERSKTDADKYNEMMGRLNFWRGDSDQLALPAPKE